MAEDQLLWRGPGSTYSQASREHLEPGIWANRGSTSRGSSGRKVLRQSGVGSKPYAVTVSHVTTWP